MEKQEAKNMMEHLAETLGACPVCLDEPDKRNYCVACGKKA